MDLWDLAMILNSYDIIYYSYFLGVKQRISYRLYAPEPTPVQAGGTTKQASLDSGSTVLAHRGHRIRRGFLQSALS